MIKIFIVINKNNVIIEKSLKNINKKLSTTFVDEDFKKYNNNYILNIDDDNLDYQRDINQLQRVFISKLFKKDVAPLITYAFLIFLILLQVISLTAINSNNSTMIELFEAIQKAFG